MLSVLKIDDILRAQGYRRQPGSGGAEAAEWQRRAEGRKALTRRMGDEARTLSRMFGRLNWLAQQALNEPSGPWRPEQELPITPGGRDADLLSDAARHTLLTWDGETGVVFTDRDAALYLGGGWVEEYAGFKVSGARADGGWAPRLRIEHVDSGAANELDAVAVHGNRLLAVECKAARAADDKVADWVYKLSQLARSVGGQLAQPLLLSAHVLQDVHRQRAKEYGVHVLAGDELGQLPEYLRRWMAGT
jgi:hypothetical protein